MAMLQGMRRRLAPALCPWVLAAGVSLGGCDAVGPGDSAESPSPHPGHPAATSEAEREKILSLERAWSAMYGGGDVDGIADLLADDTVLLAAGSPPVIGRDAVVAATRAMISEAEAGNVMVAWEPEDAFLSASGDMAWDYGRATTTLADGSVIEGSYLVVWRKERGVWKVVADIFN